ncbi:GvpL/GvpF family gas vesicle protein [Pectobacteriaceae bacterium CE70]|nr:GvpL/GvpF family gas vesicle protein [Pectobacteriaceae bacterium C52]WJV67089.1 GvpL/GvpF family gas vesicle protein [Pectobacteriaceae bacterium CE70]WJY11073.1 GvpL/GvpF family gas vesicle protein [Pectobacteriaceae bacterium C80]WJY14885.1 GvpL/GvpF family gas vesicle protein [Pectobacteriaceae bacterium CE90]
MMSIDKSRNHRAKVLYALCVSDDSTPNYKIRGLEAAPVYSIDQDGLRAVVSDTLSTRLRPERRNITAHQAVLHKLTEEGTVLPMRFGVIARNAEAVKNLLVANQDTIREHFERLDGCVEMGLRVSWDVANIYEYFVATYPVLSETRDEIWNGNSNANNHREEKIRLGNLYESLRSGDRKESTEKVKEVLLDYCEEIIENPVKKEKDVMNLACLVARERMDEFAKGVFEASKLFDNVYLFDYTGPWAPHNFVTLDLHAPTAKKKTLTRAGTLSD